MSISAPINSVAANVLAAVSLPIMLLTFGFPVASAQCSQATLPEATSSSQPAASLRGNSPPPASAESSSSSESANGVRFAIGSAITVLEETPLQVICNRQFALNAPLLFTALLPIPSCP